MALLANFLILLLLLGRVYSQQQHSKNEVNQSFVTREEFEALKQEYNALQTELNYWQNTTINLLMKYLINNEHEDANQCSTINEVNQKMEGIINQNQGFDTKLSTFQSQFLSIEDKLEGMKLNISQVSHPSLGTFLNPTSSCKLIPQGSPSGYYWIQHTGTGYAKLEYCDMTRRCCNSTGGWMRVANLNMTDSNQQCPSGFRLITSPKRTCGTPGSRCVSTTFPLNGVKYSRVCGKTIGYQKGRPNAFGTYYHNRDFTVDDRYVDGISLTHGQSPRKHIWTFASFGHETDEQGKSNSGPSQCPCSRTDINYTGVTPPFIAQDYFCDTGSRYYSQLGLFYHVDPLWDGSGCGSTSSCCGFNNPPWFCKQLPQPTSDDIEMRVCLDQDISIEDIALETVELYVQ